VQLTKDLFIENMSNHSTTAKAKFDDGKAPQAYPYLDALFDAVDTNRDGYLQLGEYEKMMKADAGTAKIVFDTIDTMESSQGRSLRPTMSSSGSL
jgi:hypothetical protein